MILAAVTGPLAQGVDDIISMEVLPGWRTESGAHMAAIRIRLAEGWKTYWRAPGDAGIPPAFDLTGSTNLEHVQFHWPVPDVFFQNGMRSIGYAGDVIVPIEVTPNQSGTAMQLQGDVNLGVCRDICAPVQLTLNAELPVTGARDVAIVTALVDRPLSESEANVTHVTCRIEPISDGLRLTADIDMPSTGHREHTVIEAGDPQVWVSEPTTTRHGDHLTASADLVHVRGGGFALDRSQVRITVLGSERAVDIQGCQS